MRVIRRRDAVVGAVAFYVLTALQVIAIALFRLPALVCIAVGWRAMGRPQLPPLSPRDVELSRCE